LSFGAGQDMMTDSLQRYELLEKIGEGTYGVVYRARDLTMAPESPTVPDAVDESLVALKKMRLAAHDEGVPVTTLREVALLKDLRHRNIVRLRAVIPQPPRLYLVFDYMDYDLKQCLDAQFHGGMPLPLIRACMIQILSGLAFCHARLVLHRDLKPQNVLIDRCGRVKLADFGLARAFQAKKTYTQEVVTLWYRAPELLLGDPEYSASVDLWSTGCILAELSCRRPLFPGDSEIDQLFRIFRLLGTPSEASWPGVTKLPDYQAVFPLWRPTTVSNHLPKMDKGAANLLTRLITYNPSKRLRAEDALRHSFFDDVRNAEFLVPLHAHRYDDKHEAHLSTPVTLGPGHESLVNAGTHRAEQTCLLPVDAASAAADATANANADVNADVNADADAATTCAHDGATVPMSNAELSATWAMRGGGSVGDVRTCDDDPRSVALLHGVREGTMRDAPCLPCDQSCGVAMVVNAPKCDGASLDRGSQPGVGRVNRRSRTSCEAAAELGTSEADATAPPPAQRTKT